MNLSQIVQHDTNNKKIIVATRYLDNFILTDENYSTIADCINSIYSINNNLSIQFDCAGEGLPLRGLLSTDQIVRLLVKNFDINLDNITFLSGSIECEENHRYYLKHCATFNLIPLQVIFNNAYEYHARDKIQQNLDFYTNILIRNVSIKKKKFLCFNRRPAHHRLYITAEAIKRNLLDDAYFSMYLNANESDNITAEADAKMPPISHMHMLMPTLAADVEKTILSNIDKFPMRLSLSISDPHGLIHDSHLYNNSYFGIVTETKFFADTKDMDILKNDMQLDCIFFSEKTFKFISGKLPFVLVGFPNSLKVLRERGYKTFHPFINESYDSIENDEERLKAIMNEIERLYNYTDDEFLEFENNVLPMVEYNFKKLMMLR